MKLWFSSILIVILYLDVFPNRYIAHIIINKEKVADYYVKDGRVYKEVYFAVGTKECAEIHFKYGASKKVSVVKFAGKKELIGTDEPFEKKLINDGIVQSKLLKDKFGIVLPLQGVTLSEVSDMTNLCENSYHITETNKGNSRALLFNDINKKIRFYPSYLEGFISINDVVKNYKVTLKNGNIVKEEIFFDKGQLTRLYSWETPRTLVIEVTCKYKDRTSGSYIKKIVIE